MKRLSFLLALLPLLCIAATETSYFSDRSGSIIVTPKNIQDDSFVYVSDKFTTTSKQIEETSIADYISHVVGGPVINKNSARDSLPVGSIFDKAPANLLVVVDSVGQDIVSRYETVFPTPLRVLEGGQKMKLTKVAYPQDSIASLATIATGNTPSVHGIVNKQWRNEQGVAFSAYKAQALPAVGSVFDIISQVFEGKSLIVSTSADYQMASALGLHQYLHAGNVQSNKIGFYYNNDIQQYDSLYHGVSAEFPLRLSSVALLERMATRTFSLENVHDKVRFVPETLEFFVDMPSGNVECIFDLNKKEDFLFFAEIEFTYAVLAQLQSSSLVSDSTPDMLSFAFSSLKGVQTRYGKNSQQLIAALAILDSVLVDVISKVNTMYNNKLATEVVFLGSSAFTSIQNMNVLRDAVFKNVKNIVNPTVFNTYFPVIYGTTNNICEKVKMAVEDFPEMQLEAVCPYAEPLILRDIRFVRQSNNSNNNTNGGDDYPFAVAFQIVLWISIILALSLAAIIYAICFMDVGADSSLYRTANPKFHAQ